MKMTVTLLFLVGSLLVNTGFAQSTATPERKYYYLTEAEKAIQSLPFPQDSISNVIQPEVMAKRQELAPNFPIYPVNTAEEEMKSLFFAWTVDYPQEFELYYAYLATYVRTNKAH